MGSRSYVPSLFRRRRSTLPFLSHRRTAPLAAEPAAPAEPPARPAWRFADAAAVAKARERHARAYEPWTAYEEQRLALEIAAGRSLTEVAASLERPLGAVRARAKKLSARANAASSAEAAAGFAQARSDAAASP